MNRPTPETRAWLVRAGSNGEAVEHNLRHGVVTYAWDQLPDLHTYASKDELKDAIDTLTPGFGGNAHKIGNHAGQLWRFRNEIRPGDVVVMPLQQSDYSRPVAIGRVSGQYRFDASQERGALHRVPVEWLHDGADPLNVDSDLLRRITSIRGTVRQVGGADIAMRLLRSRRAHVDVSDPVTAAPETPVYVLTWNPRPHDMQHEDLAVHRSDWLDMVQATEGDGTFDDSWTTGSRKGGINVGDDLVLFLHGSEGGIIASGTATSEIYGDPADSTNWIDVEWQHWVAQEDCLPVTQLREVIAPTFFKHAPRGSGRRLAGEEALSLKRAWAELLEHFPSPSGDEAGVHRRAGQMVPDGAISRAEVNRYERSRWARAECLKHYGYECQVCGLDFEKRYGELGRGFMHVHHVTPLHEVAGDPAYRLNPIDDLRPVCPNCHAMLHRPTDRTLTVEELRAVLSPAGPADT